MEALPGTFLKLNLMNSLFRWSVLLAIVICPIVLAAVSLLRSEPVGPFAAADSQASRIAEGRKIYMAQCAQCHGANLQGQLNWKEPLASGRFPAPPHDATGHTWHHADDVLIGITKFGLKPYAGEDYESDMPLFEGKLTGEQIVAVWDYIKSTWPERQRQYQERITAQARAKGQAPASP